MPQDSLAPVSASLAANDRRSIRRRLRLLPVLATISVAAIGIAATALLWQTYEGKPWTRDGTVRAYVVTLAPQIAGEVTELTVSDNQFVHKGDLLMKIDPRDYQVAVDFGKAAVDQAQADYDNKKKEAERRLKLTDLVSTPEEQQTYVASANIALAAIEQQRANLRRAEINLERTEIRSPVNGWVTNLQLRQGDYTATGQAVMSLVDSDSFWIDGYFEETALRSIKEGQPVKVWLLGYREVLQGHVESVARGIVVANAAPGNGGLASVNPIFTWVRLAQRVPVRVQIDHVPPDVRLVIGMTATVEVEPPAK
jgi:RND family efflux transporter MFP subunit